MALVQTTRDVDAPPLRHTSAASSNELHAHASADALEWAGEPATGAPVGFVDARARAPMLSPVMQYQRLQRARHHAAGAANEPPAPNGHSDAPHLSHGFMSSFLQAEKERMRELASHLSPVESSTNTLHVPPSSNHLMAGPTITTSAAAQSQSQWPHPSNSHATSHIQLHQNQPPNHLTFNAPVAPQDNPLAAGGLMPAAALAPFSRMPDNAIGQAYNAAVGRALAAESGR